MPDTAPVEVVGDDNGEMRIRMPVVVIEGEDTSDGRFIAAGALSPRALPLSILALTESEHGGDQPGPATIIGRLDTLERVPGPEVTSKRTGEPFPEGTFIWQGEGVLDAHHPAAELVRRRFLRGVSVDLVGLDYEVLGEDSEIDPENPRRQLVTHAAEIAAVTLVPVPAFGDAYIELADDPDAAPVPVEELPEGLLASAVPAWRSAEVGDSMPVLDNAAGVEVKVPADAAAQLAEVIDTGEDRDASELARVIVDFIATTWTDDVDDDGDVEVPVTAAAEPDDPGDPPDDGDEVGLPDAPQPCQYGREPAVRSLLFDGGERFVPVCDEHEQQARDEIEARGHEVDGVVDIADIVEGDEDEENVS